MLRQSNSGERQTSNSEKEKGLQIWKLCDNAARRIIGNWKDANTEPEKDEEEDDAEPLNSGAQETMFSAEEAQCGTRMAPAEGLRPVSIVLDEDTEYLSFPAIFGGNKLQPVFPGRPMSYSDIAKSFAMRYDRRVAQRRDYLLVMAKKTELLRLSSNMSLCLRKKKIRNRNDINTANLSNNDFIHGLVQHDDAYRVLAGVQNSYTHWHNEKQKVLAMVRQFGLPNFFLTLSAAEKQCPELLQILKRVVDHESINIVEALALPYAEKSRLIQLDPVACLFITGSFAPPNRPHPKDPLQLELQCQERCLLMPAFKFLHETRNVVQRAVRGRKMLLLTVLAVILWLSQIQERIWKVIAKERQKCKIVYAGVI
ncbi:unnamed protein product [Gongylonema pulchrum]|uniref:Helitron_like_N domain-containing protein n=1 Tax=Gongylonema pulchrum TaxID=637853 RepID=A0A183DPC4_9BILA|nr:unnamed protein product [Gongylonema pulchrum]